MRILVLLFHPNYAQSRVNKALIEGLDDDVKVRDMYGLYPKFNIDIKTEQKNLANADRIVLQFPMYWYGAPALTKQWEELVLEHGWAYGTKGTALKGKELIIAVSPGANNYGRNGFVKYTIHELLRPYQSTSHLVNMRYLKPFVTIGSSNITDGKLKIQVMEYNKYLHSKDIPVLDYFE